MFQNHVSVGQLEVPHPPNRTTDAGVPDQSADIDAPYRAEGPLAPLWVQTNPELQAIVQVSLKGPPEPMPPNRTASPPETELSVTKDADWRGLGDGEIVQFVQLVGTKLQVSFRSTPRAETPPNRTIIGRDPAR